MSSLPSRRSQRRTYASKDLHEDFGARPPKSRVISLRRVTDDERLSDGAEAPPLFGTVEAPLDAFGVDDLVRHLTERKRLGFSVEAVELAVHVPCGVINHVGVRHHEVGFCDLPGIIERAKHYS